MTIGDALNALRLVNLATLLVTMALLGRPALRAFRHNVQKGDLLWFVLWSDAFNRVWFVARSLHFGNETYVPFEAEVLALCYLFAILIQGLVIRAYLWRSQ